MMKTLTSLLVALTLLALASSANAGNLVLGDKILDCTVDNQNDCGNPAYPEWSFHVPGVFPAGDGIPGATAEPSHLIATIVDEQPAFSQSLGFGPTPVSPGGSQYLQLDTTNGGGYINPQTGLPDRVLFRADYALDISAANGLLVDNGGTGTMTHASVSADINYN